MKNLLLTLFFLIFVSQVDAQQKQGKVIYQRQAKMEMLNSDDSPGSTPWPQVISEELELNFANNRMILINRPPVFQETLSDEGAREGSVSVSAGGGSEEQIYCDFSISKKIEKRVVYDKIYIVSDTLVRQKWKISEQIKSILGYTCRKATYKQVIQRNNLEVQNGQMKNRMDVDTVTVVAWFTTDIPVPAGPELQGQLPGLILELEINEGQVLYQALEIDNEPNLKAIKVPSKGKAVTRSEFEKELGRMLNRQ